MNKESVIAYGIAVAGGLAWLWFSLSIVEAVVAGFATLGLSVVVWHAIDTIDSVARNHYAPKKKGE
ncbi:MAG: hypothetical protein EB131_06850 [Betaproteobacteria bacterium]|nr:hypothetical protein [Betaproteobacteria bacterium]